MPADVINYPIVAKWRVRCPMPSNYRCCALLRIWQSAFFFSMLSLRLAVSSLSAGQPNSGEIVLTRKLAPRTWPTCLTALVATILSRKAIVPFSLALRAV
jgi:hypothetical protein